MLRTETPKVSIVMPVYNAECYLKRALDSILAQTLQEWELLIIDDGSNDFSPSICDEYAVRDNRIRAVHKKNAGVSAARQDGLDAAKGEYIIHADSDDWVEPTMLEELYAKAKQENADVVICDYYNDDDKGNATIKKQQPSSLLPFDVLRELFQQLHGSCCNKLVRRVCYNKYDIRFPEGINYCEDLLTCVQLFSHEDVKVAYLNKAFYHYIDNSNSITRNYQRPQYETRCRFVDQLERVLPAILKEPIINSVKFNVFVEANIYNVLNETEVKAGMRQYKQNIARLNPRWRVGFFLLSIGLNSLAHKFLKY